MTPKEYMNNLTDEELFTLVEAFSMETIPYEHPIRVASHAIMGNENIVSILGLAVPIAQTLAERLWFYHHNNLNA